MDFVRIHFVKMNLWPVEHFFEHICHHFWVGATANKYAQKSVQLVRGSSLRSEFLQSPYFRTHLQIRIESQQFSLRALIRIVWRCMSAHKWIMLVFLFDFWRTDWTVYLCCVFLSNATKRLKMRIKVTLHQFWTCCSHTWHCTEIFTF